MLGGAVRRVLMFVRLVAALTAGAVFTTASVVAVAPRVSDFFTAHSSTPAKIEFTRLATTSLVYSGDGRFLGQLKGDVDRKPVTLDEISAKTVAAVLAVEDAEFYSHKGINAKAITRALLRNVSAGGIEQGGSTITQQLVKKAVLDDASRDFIDRKVPEAVLALRLERQMTKDEILELYLNTVYFGGGAYGVQAASERFFNKAPKDLDWAESALLSAMINNPNRNDPTINPERAIQQRSAALRRLVDTKHITENERRELEAVRLPDRRFELASGAGKLEDGYFLEEVKQVLLNEPALGATPAERREVVFAGGLRVYTTLDPKAQAAAEAAVRDNLPEDDRDFVAAMAAIEPATGAVRAIVGGPGFDRLKFNIATSKGRQTGSAFKTFVLAAAMEQGVVSADLLDGTGPCTFDNRGAVDPIYTAQNFNNDFGSWGTVEALTLRSSNCGYLRLGQVVGIPNVIATARALGLKANLENVMSLPLGVVDITPLDMAASYAAIANDGVRAEPYYIERIEDRTGKVWYEHKPSLTRAISVQSARQVTKVMTANVQAGTGTRARLGGQPAAGKTGTTQDFSDAWFVGYTPYLATAVWMGNASFPIEMRGVGPSRVSVTGGTFPAQIWGAFNRAFHEDKPPVAFAPPEPTRSGRDLRTEAQIRRANPCDGEPYTVDSDNDGTPDACPPDPAAPPTATPPAAAPPGVSPPVTTASPGASPPTTR